MTDTSVRFADRFGSRTGEFALIVAGTVLLGLAFPGAGFLGVLAARYSGASTNRGRMRALVVVALALVALDALVLGFAIWDVHTVQTCWSLDGGATTCSERGAAFSGSRARTSS